MRECECCCDPLLCVASDLSNPRRSYSLTKVGNSPFSFIMLLSLFVLAAQRPPQPPSLPPSGAKPLFEIDAPRRSAIAYDYTWSEGFIGSGGDVEPPAKTTVDKALKHCDALPTCRGITYKGTNSTKDAQNIYFKMYPAR